MNPTVLITGVGGLIGRYLMSTADRWAPGWTAVGIARQQADLTDDAQVRSLFTRIAPAAVIHCAALSRAAQCEEQPGLARAVNVEATERLAVLAHDRPFIFFSTDQVFDGAKGHYVESDEVRPLNVYGETKAEAERLVLQNPAHSVIRIALTAGSSPGGGRSFVEDMQQACRRGQALTLFTDEFRCPLPAGAIARAVWDLLDHGQPGLYHLGGAERLSRWEIGQALCRWYPEFAACLKPGSVTAYKGPRRPADLSMRSEKLQRLLSFPLPGFRDWLLSRPHRGHDLWDYLDGQ